MFELAIILTVIIATPIVIMLGALWFALCLGVWEIVLVPLYDDISEAFTRRVRIYKAKRNG